MKLRPYLILASTFIFCACATIVKSGKQKITINSNPTEAHIVVKDQFGNQIISSATPAILNLDKGNGYFQSTNYTIEISKPGFAAQQISLSSSLDGWYIAGNLVIGGLIGWLIVDPTTGAMWTLSPDIVNTDLQTIKATGNPHQLNITLLQDVPDSIQQKMIPVKRANLLHR